MMLINLSWSATGIAQSRKIRINKLSPNPRKAEYMIFGYLRKFKALDFLNPLTINGSEIYKDEIACCNYRSEPSMEWTVHDY